VTRLVAVPVLALLVISAGCSKDECSGGDRCSGNTMQTCGPSGPYGTGPNTWTSIGHCDSPQVCRMNAIGPNPEPNAPSQSGCFNPNAYCLEGSVLCEETAAGPTLWSCVLRTSDQTVQWSRTICSPPTNCIAILTGAAGGCYEVVRSCPAFDTHCEGNVLLTCSHYPTLIDNKAVYDWTTYDCTPVGLVCRTPPNFSSPGCIPP
jgi:hypothetical protein